MEIPDFLNVDCSEDEDAEDAAELEAHLYSKIYYEDTVGDVETSVTLYTEAEVLIYFGKLGRYNFGSISIKDTPLGSKSNVTHLYYMECVMLTKRK